MASSATRKHLDPKDVIRCDSMKLGHASKADALTAADDMMRQDRVMPGCHLTPYLCDRCRQWHVYNRVIVPLAGRAL